VVHVMKPAQRWPCATVTHHFASATRELFARGSGRNALFSKNHRAFLHGYSGAVAARMHFAFDFRSARIDSVQPVSLQSRNPRSRIRAPSMRGLDGHSANRRSYSMIIELGKVTQKTQGTDFGLKVDSNVGVKLQRYNTAF
jgi:hypothetical protein